MKANVFVTLKAELLDPQGDAVKNALRALGFDEVAGVRVGKFIEVTIDAPREDETERVAAMCKKLLANPVTEDARFEVECVSEVRDVGEDGR